MATTIKTTIKTHKFTFDEEKHLGYIEGALVPTVTQALQESGWFDYSKLNQQIREITSRRGSVVHAACELDDQNNLLRCADEVMPYVEGWRKFKKFYRPKFVIREKRFWSLKWRFCGKPDRGGVLLLSHAFQKSENILVDIKAGDLEEWHKYQLAGYEILLNEDSGVKIHQRWTVYLDATGDFAIDPHKNKHDKMVFLDALRNCHNLRKAGIR